MGPFYRLHVFMQTTIHMLFDCVHFACFSFFFCIYTEKDIRHNWTKLPYVGLHLNQQPREPVCLKKRQKQYNNAQKIFYLMKSAATMSV